MGVSWKGAKNMRTPWRTRKSTAQAKQRNHIQLEQEHKEQKEQASD